MDLKGRLPTAAGCVRTHLYLLATAVLGILLAVFFGPLLRHGDTFSDIENLQQYSHPWVVGQPEPQARLYPQVDDANFVHPRQVFVDHSLKVDHQLPLWNPQMFGGHPYFANDGSRLAYPPLLLLTALFSPTWTHDLYIMIHLFVAGLALFALMREYGVGIAGSLLAGVAWAFSSYAMGWIMIEMFAAPVALLPLALLCVRRWYDRDSWSSVLVGILVLGFLYLGTSVELAFLSFVCVGGYAGSLALARLVSSWSRLTVAQRLAVVAMPVILVVGALAVSAVGLLPFLDLSRHSERSSVSDLTHALTVVPVNRFWFALRPPGVPLEVFTAAYAVVNSPLFVGSATAVLAMVGLLLRRPGSGLGRALVVGLFLFTIGTPVTWLALHVVPKLDALRGYGRTLFLWDLGVAVLGGLGLDAVIRWLRRRRDSGMASRPGWAWRALPVLFAALCIVVTSVQLLVHGRHVNPPFQPRHAAQLFPATAAIEEARSVMGRESGRARLLPMYQAGDALPVMNGSIGMALDLPVASGYEPVLPTSTSRWIRVLTGEPVASVLVKPLPGTFFPYFGSATVRADLLGRAGVGAILAPPGMAQDPGWTAIAAARGLRKTYGGLDGTVYEVTDRPPRASVVSDAVWVTSVNEALERFADPAFDARRQVILQRGAPAPVVADPPVVHPPAPATVAWLDDRPNDVRLRVTSATPGWLVLLDSFDPGWHAKVDGHPAQVARADYNFRAVRVAAGSSTVSFTYRPTSVVVGGWVSLLSVVVILGLLVSLRVRSSRRGAIGGGPAPAPPSSARSAPSPTAS